ncbi:MAG: phage tail tape measure protein [Clostridiales bacterium]|nr:phage tail tape measure protein [Clostridiales bacterium]
MAIFKVTAVPDFSQLKSELTKLQGSPVTLNVDTQQANVNLKATAQNLTKLTRVFDGNNRLTGAVSQFSGKVGETVQITQRLNAETGKLETTQGKVTQNFEAQSRAAQKAAAQMRAANDAYRAYAAQQSGTYTPTAIQSRIEDITGIGGLSGKSAKESATVFEKAFLTASGKVQQSAEKAAQKVKSVGQATKESSGFADLMGKSFGKIVAQMAMWQLLGNAIAGVKRSFTEALETMKDVDDEMVTIRKVTGATTAELDKIEKQAYETASAYGVAADEYLNSVANFSRAGYGEQASALAELATKTQIVGDTDAETAQQFLLSVDAAYQYKGSIEQLTKVLDGANEIDNKYATSISKIAEGLGKVAPIAAQAHVGVDELTAAIGTITAVTQRSGTEASTALRALFLNIIGDTKTEIDEGVTWTTGEIAGLRDVIKIYAKDAYDAAQATGSVIDPMKAIAGLAQSMKDGLLTEQQLMEMVSDIGGKLRTSQLLALIQNWDMYESMLGDFANAAGSADKEVENALDSWSRKTEILHNKWTEFVSHLVETDTIKDALDVVIGLVEFLDSDTGRLVIQMGLLAGAVALANKGLTALMTQTAIGTFFGTLTSAIGGNAMAMTQLTGQMKNLLAVLPKIGIGAAIFAALAVAISLSTEKARAYEKSLEDVKAAQSALDETKSEYDELINKTEELTDAEKRRLEVLQATREEQEKQLEAAKKKAWEDWNAIHGTGATVIVDGMDANTGGMAVGAAKTERMDIVALRNYREELAQIEEQYRAGEMSAGEYYTALEKLNAAREESVETIRAAIAAGYDVTEEQKALVAAYDNTSIILGKVTGITYEWIASLIEEARAAGTAEDALYDTVSAAKILSNTKLDLNQQIQALAMLRFQLEQTAIQAAYTAKEISLVGLLTGTVGNIISSTVSSVLDGAGSAGQGSGVSAAAGSSSGGSSGSGGSSDAAERKRAQAAIKELEKQRDAEIEPLEDQIDALKKQNEEIERGEKLEELKLDVLKKQDALLNAHNERTVRQYNAATGQWEWVADANKVKDAEEDLENAKKDLRDYEREVELDLAVAELEARIEAIKAAYQIKIDAWQDYLDGLDGAVAAEGEYLNTSVKQNKDAAEAIADAWEEAAERKRKAQAAISAAAGAAADVPSSTNPSTSAAVSGAVGGAANSPSSTKPSASGAVAGAVGGAAKPKPSGGGGVNKVARYDSGGVLKGLGGIKATVDDEMVLPPDITEKMLRPSANGVFRQRMGELGYLYGVERPAAQNMAGKSDNRSYTDHSGPEYHYGSITLTEEQAETTTVAELRRMAHHLQPYGG